MESFNYAKPRWQDASRRELTYDENGKPVLEITDFTRGGSKTTLTGAQALNYAPRDNDSVLPPNTSLVAPAYISPDDFRESMAYKGGQTIRRIADDPEPTLIGRLFNTGPVAGSLAGAGTGWLLGKILEWINPGKSDIKWSTIGLLGGGLGGGLTGYYKNKIWEDQQRKKREAVGLLKQSMFRDPRNFILERLQGANDISPYEKAQLAARVRQMNIMEAERLKEKVRAAAGFGVGAIISRFVFGAGWVGTTVGGLAGALASKLLPTGNRPPTGIFSHSGNYF